MKNNIKTILAALIMLLSGAVTAMADVDNPQPFMKFTKTTLSVDKCYYEFEYPDYNFEMKNLANPDAARDIKISISINKQVASITLATMYRCHDEMKRQNTQWGAVQIMGTRNINPETHETIRQEEGKDPKGLRIVTVRYYPSCSAMENIRYINLELYWDIDDDDKDCKDCKGYKMSTDQLYSEVGYQNYPKYDESGQSGSLGFNGDNFILNNYNLGNTNNYEGWTRKVSVCDNASNALWGNIYFDGNVSSNGSYTLNNVEFNNEVSLYAWNYLTRDIKVKNGSYHPKDGDVTVNQRALLRNPLKLSYKYNSGYITDIAVSRSSICGKSVVTVKGDAKKANFYTADIPTYDSMNQLSYMGSVDLKSGAATYIIENDNPFVTKLYIAIPCDPNWTGRPYLKSSFHKTIFNHLVNDNFEGEGNASSPYMINNIDDFSRMRVCVNNGRKAKGTHWKLMNDLAFADSPNDFNLMFETGTDAHKFDGVFDGNGHTITVNVNDNNMGTRALFGKTSNAVIKNLKVTGTINVNEKFGAGFVSSMFDGTISNCWSDVTIYSTVNGDGTHGGIVAIAEPGSQKCVIRDCVFTGSISGSNTNACGGFVGWSRDGRETLKLIDCLNFGTYNLDTENCDAFARNGAEMQNCYYLNDLGTNLTNATKLTEMHKGFGMIGCFSSKAYHYGNSEYPVLKVFSGDVADVDIDGSSKLITTNDYADADITLTRNFYAGERCTVMLPFDVDAAKAQEMGKFYTLKKIIAENNRAIFTPVTDGVKANTPYVMEAAQTVSSLTFDNVTMKATAGNPDASKAPAVTKLVGTTKPVTAPTGAYGYSAGDASHARSSFVKVGTNVKLPAFCAYLWINGNAPKTMEAVFTDEDGDITGIETLYQDEENPSIYSLDGRKLDKPERGINIINGKKVIVK